jgi:bifunctional DNA-binding transcriptional regulator/antitoxin component of YhaV-PrlF toxin-antitoxin module
MQKLTVDVDGKIRIPADLVDKHGLRPGDELALVESPGGLLVCHDAKFAAQMELAERVMSEDREALKKLAE